MTGVSAGARVWLKNGDALEYGAILSIGSSTGYLTAEGSLVIVLEGGHVVVATTMATRGTTWDVVSDLRQESPAQAAGGCAAQEA